MRTGLLLCLAVVLSGDLSHEDLGSVRQALQKTDPSLERFDATGRKSIDPTRSVMIVAASGPRRDDPRTLGVFIVAGTSNRVLQVVDTFPEAEANGFPLIGEADTKSIVLHFYGDYGFYYGSVKYFYDRVPVRKFHYEIVALRTAEARNGELIYKGAAYKVPTAARGYEVMIVPRPGELPTYTMKETDAAAEQPPPVTFPLAGGGTATVTNSSAGQGHRPGGFTITDRSGKREFYPAPTPTMELHRKLRASAQAPGEIENDVGPAALDGSTIWYANSFYDGEGVSGVGALGEFDLRTHKYRMHYLPQVAPWSGSALRIDGDDLWIGLMRRPEGADYGGGLLRYNRTTGDVVKFDVPAYISSIDRVGDAIYCGTSNGLYVIRGEIVTHMSFEPDRTGKLTMVTR